MIRQMTERIIAVLLVLFLLAYVGYQAYRYFRSPLDTETIYEHTVSQSISTRGIAVRREVPLEQAATGNEYYPLENASRVALNETVAELRQGGVSGDTGGRRARELEEELRLLREAQSVPAEYANIETYNRDLKTGAGQLSAMVAEGRYTDLAALRKNLMMNINKRQISNGKATSFTERIGWLEGQLQQLTRTLPEGDAVAVKAPRPGFFSSVVDGYETLITPAMTADLSVADCLRHIEGRAPAAPKLVGKLVLDEKWTFVAPVPKYQLEWINEMLAAKTKVGQKLQVRLQLDQVARSVPAVVEGIIEERDSDTAVLLLTSDRMTEELINLRVSDAEIAFEQHTGLRINAADLRFRTRADGTTERGVYILRNNLVYFRLVDPIYEEPGFVLSRTYYSAEEYLEPQRQARRQQQQQEEPAPDDLPDPTLEEEEAALDSGQAPQDEYRRYVILFDQVITKGKDLYDEKTVPVH